MQSDVPTFRPRFGSWLRCYAQLARTLLPGGAAAATPLGYRLLQRIGVDAPDVSSMLSAQSVASAATLDAFLLCALVVSIPFGGANLAYVGIAVLGTLVTGVIDEAVLTSSLIGFGVAGAEAIIGVLAYRLFEFWLPIPIGAAAYLSARAADPSSPTAPGPIGGRWFS